MSQNLPKTKEELIKQVAKEMEQALLTGIGSYLSKKYRTCLYCSHFDESKEICNLHNQRPPARIIARGCEDCTDDIPF